MKKTILITALTSVAVLLPAHAVIVAANFGSTVGGTDFNNYATPSSGDYSAGAGTFTTSTSGTTGASGANYNTVQTFTDTASGNTDLTLAIVRSSAKVFNQTTSPVYDNSTAISAINSDFGLSTTDLNSSVTNFITSGAGGSNITSITLDNLHHGSSLLGYNLTLYVGAATRGTDGGTLTTFDITGGTQDSLAYAGQGGTGFDSATLAGSGPGLGEITLLKWTGTLTSAQDSLVINLDSDGNKKAGIGMFAYEITPVPEPSSAALLGLGGLALILRRRK